MNLTKYVLGVAAKSNVEKRQVGCIIVHNATQTIVAEGFNTENEHAEIAAIEDLVDKKSDYEGRLVKVDPGNYTAYVTHQPCPECAASLFNFGIKDVEVVEAFMKFDGDKPRYDLMDGAFAYVISQMEDPKAEYSSTVIAQCIRDELWRYVGDVKELNDAIWTCRSFFETSLDFEKAVVAVLTFGARKYKANNWKKCSDTGRYLAAAHRHAIAIIEGEDLDPETGLSHFAHIGCNLMFLYVLGLNYDNSNK